MKVREIKELLNAYDDNEELALTGWWSQSLVQTNNDVRFTKEQWIKIVELHEDGLNIDEAVTEVLSREVTK